MSLAVALVFPHQLFKDHPAAQPGRPIYLVEEALFFNQYLFHKKKLVLHRASMQYYAMFLEKAGHVVQYIESNTPEAAVATLVERLQQKGVQEIHFADLTDDWLYQHLSDAARHHQIKLVRYNTPQFINDRDDVLNFGTNQKAGLQTDFYISQRKLRSILMDGALPIGGKWTYDEENRAKLPKGAVVPYFSLPAANSFVQEAITYVEKHFPDNYGTTSPPFYKKEGFYPVTHAEAEAWLDDFLENRFALFGTYQDAIMPEQAVLFHSVLSPLLNTGLLLPQQVLDKALAAAEMYSVPLNALEGFIRQVLGWREFVRLQYETSGRHQRTTNFWKFTRTIPPSFYTGNTGIDPVDTVVKKVLQNGYAHHIERLMVLGNFLLLCEFHPDAVYRYFMELFVDAYDWVMVPNTYGITQFAEGGNMISKPYISSSNYLMKMGNWKRQDWQQTWDALFWRFMQVHRDVLEKNNRIGLLLHRYDAKDAVTKKNQRDVAEAFLKNLGKKEEKDQQAQLTF